MSLSRRLADRSGAAAVELALVMPLLILFLFGIWELGWGLYNGGEVRHAVELGSRIYITNPSATSTDLSTAVASHLADVPISSVSLAVSSQTVSGASVEHITWSYRYTANIPLMSSLPLNFSGVVDMPLATP
jgi:Flp pilus assembly protein TadG